MLIRPAPPTSRALHFNRRRALQAISAAFAGCIGAAPGAFAQPPSGLAEQWRAMSRIAYGPTPDLIRDLSAAGNPRAWALQQITLARIASQTPPRMDADVAGFNAPLPVIFEGFLKEREARAKGAEKREKSEQPKPGENMMAGDGRDSETFSRNMAQHAAQWRLASCSQPGLENPLLARMTEFWFNHLNIYGGKGAVRPFTGHYVVNVARKHAMGKFEDLLLASARHPAMLAYLDQVQSVAEGSKGANGQSRGLNENYARELMELHTLGVGGGYSQTDVRELARVLTGWTVGPKEADGFRFAERLHDNAPKKVLGKVFPTNAQSAGVREGEDAIRMLARHPSTAKRIALRLAQFFVSDNPPDALVQRLSASFTKTGGDISALLYLLLESAEFWDPANRLFKTPLDFACSALAATQTAAERRALTLTMGFLGNAGQPLHGWQTPDGYKFDTATWMVPEALTRRADFALTLARSSTEMDFLAPYLSSATRASIAQEKPAMRAGLMLASPDFMGK
jgi:uncharacterized protein (DUF1800 family)